MKNNQTLSVIRLTVYAVVVILCIMQWLLQQNADSLISLFAYVLFFLATLTRCRSQRRYRIFSRLLIFIVPATVLLDHYAFTIAGEMETAMRSMQIMTAVTMIQNIVLSLYLFGCLPLLLQETLLREPLLQEMLLQEPLLRERRLITRLLGWGIIVYFAIRLLPATWFTLQFIISAIV